jgi:DNA-binding GntR family transcriptional regulator
MSAMVTPGPDAHRQQGAVGGHPPGSGGYPGIAASIRDQIASGRMGPGEQLPSEASLTTGYKVARTTVRRALKVLEGEGLIEPQQGRGWRVRDGGGSSGPTFAGIVQDLRDRVRTGILPVGERLPSEKDLALNYSCARGTVRRALVELELEGLVETRPGVGRFVVGSAAGKRPKALKPGGQ